jgi:Tol biopolymer transport system component
MTGYLTGVVEVSLDGKSVHPLVQCGGDCTETVSSTWTTDGTRMAYAAQCAGGCGSAGDPYHGIRVLDVRTGDDRLVLPGESFTSLDWSPDGTRIAFSGFEHYEDGQFTPDLGLYVMNADGTDVTRVPGAKDVTWVSWSPDGTRLLYVTVDEMVSVKIDGSDRISLGLGQHPQWSPDGKKIAYRGTGCEIWTMSPDGTGRSSVATLFDCGPNTRDTGPEWSPDGTQLAVLLGPDVWIVGADGSHLHALQVPPRLTGRHGTPSAIAWRPVP